MSFTVTGVLKIIRYTEDFIIDLEVCFIEVLLLQVF